MEISPTTFSIILGIIAILSVVFNIYNYFRNPQIKTDQTTIKLQEDFTNLKREVLEIKETHLRAVEADIKSLTNSVNELSKTVVRLATIIDERIPKGSPGLTPPGV